MRPSARVRLRRRGMVQEHQGEQPVDLWFVHQGRQLPGESDRLGREIDVAGIALVEDEVQHPHHRAHIAGTIDAGSLDRPLGAADALCHRALGHQVGPSDLACGEATDGAEGQRDRRRRRQIGVGAQEVEAQRVVGARDRAGRRFGVESEFAVAARGFRPRHVEERSPRDRDEPSRPVGGHLVIPCRERPDERLLDGVLGGREVRTAADEDAQDTWDERAQLDAVRVRWERGHWVTVGGSAMKGRTSSHSWIGSPPAPGAADSSPASSIARS